MLLRGANSRSGPQGFTLLEVVLALGILASALAVLLGFHSRGLIFMRNARVATVASMLAEYKLREVELELEKDIAKQQLTDSEREEKGDFADLGEEFKGYRWSYKVGPVEIPLPPEPSASEGGSSEGGAPQGAVYAFMKLIADQVSKSTREIQVKVEWGPEAPEGEKNPKSVTMTTHMVNL